MRLCLRLALVIAIVGGQAVAADIPDPSPAAFENVIVQELSSSRYNRQGLLGELVDIGSFYCSIKRSPKAPSPNASKSQGGNIDDLILYAEKQWIEQRFKSHEEYRNSVQGSTDEIGMRSIAMGQADKHLCPGGWPEK